MWMLMAAPPLMCLPTSLIARPSLLQALITCACSCVVTHQKLTWWTLYSVFCFADVPVRMALGETHVIAMTKRALGEAGVNVDALESAAAVSGKAAAQMRIERSGTVLLVKNLPYTACEAELQVLSHLTCALCALTDYNARLLFKPQS